jgi:Cation transport ATPase
MASSSRMDSDPHLSTPVPLLVTNSFDEEITRPQRASGDSCLVKSPSQRLSLSVPSAEMSSTHPRPMNSSHCPCSSHAPDNARNSSDAALPIVTHALHRPSQSIDNNALRPSSQSIASTEATVVRSKTLSDMYSDYTFKFDYDHVSLSEALAPNPSDEADFHVDENRFAFSPGQLNKMQNPKSLAAFFVLGGLQGLEKGLRTDLDAGLSVDEGRLDGFVDLQQVTPHLYDKPPYIAKSQLEANPAPAVAVTTNDRSKFEDRIRTFSENKIPARKSAGFLKLFWVAYNDKIIILLTIAAIISLSLGIYETVDGGTGVEWVEGVAICVAILIVTVVTAANDWQKEKQFAKLNKRVRVV